MIDFLNLFINENIKFYKKRSTILMIIIFIILLFVCVILNYSIKNVYKPKYEITQDNKFANQKCNDAKEVFNYASNTIDNIEQINNLKSQMEVYQYVINNNINLDNSEETNYYKYEVVKELIDKQTSLYNLSSEGNEEKIKIQEEILELEEILKKDSFDSYIDRNIKKINDQYSLNIITKEEKDILLHVEEINSKYEIGKYNNLENLWKSKISNEIKEYKMSLLENQNYLSKNEINNIKNKILIDEYRLENNISFNPDMSSITNYKSSYLNIVEIIVIPILGIFFIIYGSTSMSNEFCFGTIKQILMTPNKRLKIIFSKILTIILNLLIFTFCIGLMAEFISIMFFGNYNYENYLFVSDGIIKSLDGFIYLIIRLFCIDLEILIYIIFGIMLSVLTLDSSVSVGIAIFVFISKDAFMSFINKTILLDWVRFIPFNNFNLTDKIFSYSNSIIPKLFYYNQNTYVNNITLDSSIFITLISIFLMIIITAISFNNKEL